MAVESTDQAASSIAAPESSERKPLGDICAGCSELTERIERLELLLAEHADAVVVPALSTTSCYWICIAVHAFVTFSLFAIEIAVQFGLIAVVGAIGTLAVCHVLSTRPIHIKLARTALSSVTVGFSAIAAMAVADVASPSEILPSICIYFPIVFGTAWFVTKLFVWTRGWKLLPPGGANEYPKLRIWHFFLWTFVAAVFLAMCRWLVDDVEELMGVEALGLVLQGGVPAALCTVFACLLARVTLVPNNPRVLRHVSILAASALGVFVCVASLFLLLSGGTGSSFETLAIVMLYAPFATFGALASPGFTFLMLRIAKYRMVVPGRIA